MRSRNQLQGLLLSATPRPGTQRQGRTQQWPPSPAVGDLEAADSPSAGRGALGILGAFRRLPSRLAPPPPGGAGASRVAATRG